MSEPVSSDPGPLDDPDLAAARGQEPTVDDYDALKTDELQPEAVDAGWDPPDEATMPTATGRTSAEELAGETLDERLRQEEPDVTTGQLDDVVVDDPSPDSDTGRLASDPYVPTPQAEEDDPLLGDPVVATPQADGDALLAGDDLLADDDPLTGDPGSAS